MMIVCYEERTKEEGEREREREEKKSLKNSLNLSGYATKQSAAVVMS
jgi:hypothetical protein